MDLQQHWESVYQTKSPEQTSWYQPHLEMSLDWIIEAAPDRSSSILDVGGGESTLVDDLLNRGYSNLTVLDLAESAIRKTQARLSAAGQSVRWFTGDITEIRLPAGGFDLWHDRAVFHFLTEQPQRAAYLRQLAASLRTGGHVILATFGPDGPKKCSGLSVRRYSVHGLQLELGPQFQLEKSTIVEHRTPFGTMQQFVYCRFKSS
jgi:SAM-dependent methyltransferase